MRRLPTIFLLLAALAWLMSFGLCMRSLDRYHVAQDKLTSKLTDCTIRLMQETTELRERVIVLERHLDATGQ